VSRVLSNRYSLGSLIGAGGSARVYEAHDQLLDRRVAVKVLDGAAAVSNDPAGRDRFLREAQSSARFSHQRVVAVYDAGEVDGDLFIVMELVEGTSLAELIATAAPLPESDVVRIGGQLLGALEAAHVAGIVHRDVKPANVLIDRSGDVKLADFGIAKRFDDMEAALTRVGTVVGTPQYLAPEQAAGRPATPATDVYATGVVLFEMLTGTRLGTRSTTAVDPVDVRSVRPDVSPTVADAVERALAADPERRFSSAATMAAALRGRLPPTELLLSDERMADERVAAGIGPIGETPTRVMVDAHAPTGMMPSAHSPTAVQPTSTQGRMTRWWPAAIVAMILAGGIGTAFALRDSADAPAGDDASAESATVDATAAPVSSSDAEGTVVSETTDAPLATADAIVSTSTVPTTSATAAPTAAPADDLVAGFPRTDDIDQFIDQLRDGRDIVGKQSKRLGDGLRKVADEDADKQVDAARKLAEKLDEWIDDGDIDPVVGTAALDFLSAYGG
jgi:serine/threonine-protein kinase